MDEHIMPVLYPKKNLDMAIKDAMDERSEAI